MHKQRFLLKRNQASNNFRVPSEVVTGSYIDWNPLLYSHTYIYLHVCMYVCMCLCMYVCMHVYMYVFLYVYTGRNAPARLWRISFFYDVIICCHKSAVIIYICLLMVLCTPNIVFLSSQKTGQVMKYDLIRFRLSLSRISNRCT